MTKTKAIPAPRTGTLPLPLPEPDAQGRFVATASAVPKAPRVRTPRSRAPRRRVRTLPSRGGDGRFVAYPTTSAPSWYVLCADAYRIPGEADVLPRHVCPPAAPQPLPPARVARRARLGMRREEVINWIAMLLFVVGVGWYAFHLPVPNR